MHVSLRAGEEVAIHKCDYAGRPVITYPGRIVAANPDRLVLEAEWTHGHCDLGLLVFEDGDRFVETYPLTRWWNVYEVHSRSGRLRGWYCNIARPPRLVGHDLYYDDLALDLLVSASGQVELQDEDEFAALHLDRHAPAAYWQALEAVREVRALIERRCPPFEALAADGDKADSSSTQRASS